jgi:hypothetical protein
MRCKPALDAFAITFGDRFPPAEPANRTAGNTVREIVHPLPGDQLRVLMDGEGHRRGIMNGVIESARPAYSLRAFGWS